ncbi:MAG TPA: peptidase S10 [Verrucomicrobiae bacterium]|nr:peptidase S10 [Verrucomicrobiae bacterium]
MGKSVHLLLAFVLAFGSSSIPSFAQEASKDSKPAASDQKAPSSSEQPKEESSTTDHTIQLDGLTIPYKATASTTLLKDKEGEPTALIFSVAYVRSDVKDPSQRPIAFLYNGGPGSASIWLHMGAFGPRRVVTSNAAPTPPAPYSTVDNSDCLLDKTDMVFIDPVGTGFSHAVGKAKDKDFWGVDPDIKSIAQFINTYVNRNNRWNSPKFLIGESYGTFRSAGLAHYLESHDSMNVNGIVLMSSVLDISTILFTIGNDMPYVYYLPSYAATAWYQNTLKDRPADLPAFVAEARSYAATDYLEALMKGSALTDAEKSAVAKKLSYFTGLSEDYLLKANLRVTLGQFRAELLRSQGLDTGRLDARFTGPMYDLLSEYGGHDPLESAIEAPFVAAFNQYLRETLKFNPDRPYIVLSGEVNDNWEWKHNSSSSGGDPVAPSTEGDLIAAMLANPYLTVQVENGYFDLATPFFATEYTMSHLLLPPKLQNNIHLEYYNAGHMMYLHDADRAKLKSDIESLIGSATKR